MNTGRGRYEKIFQAENNFEAAEKDFSSLGAGTTASATRKDRPSVSAPTSLERGASLAGTRVGTKRSVAFAGSASQCVTGFKSVSRGIVVEVRRSRTGREQNQDHGQKEKVIDKFGAWRPWTAWSADTSIG